jgi:hypothetical protein
MSHKAFTESQQLASALEVNLCCQVALKIDVVLVNGSAAHICWCKPEAVRAWLLALTTKSHPKVA